MTGDSGSDDEAASILDLQRCTSPRVVKETFVPATELGYPHLR